MGKYIAKRLIALLSVFLVASNLAFASSDVLQRAVTVYYAGHPHKAVDMIKPLAAEGDVEAQYLLGNILYSLSKTPQFNDFEDPAGWYQMAADQGVADASYALGVIHNNNWNNSRDKQQAAIAITHFQKALDQGFSKAERPMRKLMIRSDLTLQKAKTLARERIEQPVVEAEPVIQAMKKEEAESEAAVVEVVPAVETDTAGAEEPAKSTITMSDESAPVPEVESDVSVITIVLEDLIDQCTKYTVEGFDYYADTIRGAMLTGKAKIKSIQPDPANPGAKVIHFREEKPGMEVSFNLSETPNTIAKKYEVGELFALSGIITDTKITRSTCEVNMAYQLAVN